MKISKLRSDWIQSLLDKSIEIAGQNSDGKTAAYIPELSNVDAEQTSVAVYFKNGQFFVSGDAGYHRFTLQSVAKVILLCGLLEEFGQEEVLSWTNVEPSGLSFSSATQLDTFGPKPSNTDLNCAAQSTRRRNQSWATLPVKPDAPTKKPLD